jgi:hypothetical protein
MSTKETNPHISIFHTLMEDCNLEIADMVNDGYEVDIRIVPPRHSGGSSFLIWQPVKPVDDSQIEHREISITEYLPDMDPPDHIRKVWLEGHSLDALQDIISRTI